MGDDAALTVDDSETTTAPAGRSAGARAALPPATGAAIEADGGERGAGCDTAHERRSTSPVQAAAAGSVLVVERHDDPPAPRAGDGGEAEQCGVRGHIERPVGALAPVTEMRLQQSVESAGGGGGESSYYGNAAAVPAAAAPSYAREVRISKCFAYRAGGPGKWSGGRAECSLFPSAPLCDKPSSSHSPTPSSRPFPFCRPASAWAYSRRYGARDECQTQCRCRHATLLPLKFPIESRIVNGRRRSFHGCLAGRRRRGRGRGQRGDEWSMHYLPTTTAICISRFPC